MPSTLYFPVAILSALPTVLAFQITDTINLGALIIGLLLSGATLIGILFGVKWKVAAQVESQAKDAALDLFHIKDEESKQLHENLLKALRELGDAKELIQRLEALPNLERILNLMGEQYERLDRRASERLDHGIAAVQEAFHEVMDAHDAAAEKRTDRLIRAVNSREGRAQ